MSEGKLSDFEKDALKEIGNIGAGNASAKLSDLVNQKVMLELSEINVISSEQLSNLDIHKDQDIIIATFLRVLGDIFGSIVTLFPKDFAVKLVDLINKHEIGTTNEITPESEEKFKQIGISFADAYLSALADFLAIHLDVSEPLVQINQRETILKFMIKGVSPSMTEDVLMVKTKFSVEKFQLGGEFILLFGIKSAEEFKKLINKKMK